MLREHPWAGHRKKICLNKKQSSSFPLRRSWQRGKLFRKPLAKLCQRFSRTCSNSATKWKPWEGFFLEFLIRKEAPRVLFWSFLSHFTLIRLHHSGDFSPENYLFHHEGKNGRTILTKVTQKFWWKLYENHDENYFLKSDRNYKIVKRGKMKSEWGQAPHPHATCKTQQQEGHRTLFLLQTKRCPQAAAEKQHNPNSQLFVFL